MYHSEQIVTIQFPELQIVLDYSKMQKDRNGKDFPSIVVITDYPDLDFDYEGYFDLFLPSINEVFDQIIVDGYDPVTWLQEFADGQKLKDRKFLTTFIDAYSIDKMK